MKKIAIGFLTLALLVCAPALSFAQASAAKKEVSKDKKFRFNRLSRDVKKESKKYEKEGYRPFVGQMPINQQLDKSYRMQTEADDNGLPKWIIATGSSVGSTQGAADMQAMQLGQDRLVGLMETNFRSVVENTVSNNQISSTESISVTKSIEVSANRVSKKLGTIVPVVKIYRMTGKDQYEVQVQLAYSYELAYKLMQAELRLEFEKESDDVRKKYEQFLNPDLQPDNIQNIAD
jgi:hypothetical protein